MQTISIPEEFVSRVDFDKFWEHVAGGPETDIIPEETLRAVKSALLDAGVPTFTVHAYFTELFWRTTSEEQTGVLERFIHDLQELGCLEFCE